MMLMGTLLIDNIYKKQMNKIQNFVTNKIFKFSKLSRCDGRYVQDLGTGFTVPC